MIQINTRRYVTRTPSMDRASSDSASDMYDSDTPPFTQLPVASQESGSSESQNRQPSGLESYFDSKHKEPVRKEEDCVKCSLGLSDSSCQPSPVPVLGSVDQRHAEAKCLEEISYHYRKMQEANEKIQNLASRTLECNADWHEAVDAHDRGVAQCKREALDKTKRLETEVDMSIRLMHSELEQLKLKVHQTLEGLTGHVEEKARSIERYMRAVEVILDDQQSTLDERIGQSSKNLADFHTECLKRMAKFKCDMENLEGSIPESRRLMQEAKARLRLVNAKTADFVERHFRTGDGASRP